MDRFDAKLDGAFLLHRALVLNDRDAFDELPELLSDEILAVLEDTRLGVDVIKDIASAAIEQLELTKAKRNWTNSNGVALDCEPIFRNLLLDGESGIRTALKKCPQEKELGKNGFHGITPQLRAGPRNLDKPLSGKSATNKAF